MIVNRSYVNTGHLPSVLGTLRRRLSALKRSGRRFKIGITGYPEVRSDAYGPEYTEMVVLYQTTSEHYIRELERLLVDEYRSHIDNETRGGGGDVKGPPFYLYVVR